MKKKTPPRSATVLVLIHSLWLLLMSINAVTGLRIQSDKTPSSLSIMTKLLPQGDVWLWHIISGSVLFALFITYLWYYKAKRKKLIPSAKKMAANSIHSVAYIFLAFLIIGSSVTGVMNLIDQNTDLSARIHRVFAYGYLIFLCLHLFSHIKQAGLVYVLRIIRPNGRVRFLFSTLSAGILAIAVSLIFIFNNAITLTVAFTDMNISIDGKNTEPVWHNAPEVSVQTQYGDHLIDGQSRVTVRALHDKDNIYFYFTWQDPTRSQKHLPLIKTDHGWKILQSEFVYANEHQFYEDKFAMLLANGDALASSKSVHLGKQPLKKQPESLHGRGFHYTTDGKIYDVWHWQSVRSNMHYQADDSYFGPALPVDEHFPITKAERKKGTYARYTAGYQKDPPATWSAIGMNWETYTQTTTHPRRLPIETDDLARLKKASPSPNISDMGRWWFTWDDTQPYSKAKDHFHVGTILPSVLIKSKRPGDRGDISAHGYWQDGYWHLEMKRSLDTESAYDVAITNNTYLWFAVFDHTQTKHSRHIRPVKVHLEPKPVDHD